MYYVEHGIEKLLQPILYKKLKWPYQYNCNVTNPKRKKKIPSIPTM